MAVSRRRSWPTVFTNAEVVCASAHTDDFIDRGPFRESVIGEGCNPCVFDSAQSPLDFEDNIGQEYANRKRPMRAWFISMCLLAAAAPGHAAEITVKMLNTGKDGPMAFEPSYVKVAIGDTVIFVPAEKGAHYSVSLLQPAGAQPWRGAPDQEFKVKIEKEGLYLYACEPHKTLGMVGIIQAGKPVNLAEAKALAAKEQATFALGKTRFDLALAQVK